MTPSRRRLLLLFAAASQLTGGCAARAVRTETPTGLGWPAGQPRVALERVFAVRRSGMKPLSWITGQGELPLFERPYGVAWAGGDLVVADPAARRLVRITATGSITESDATADFSPLAVAACAAGLVAADPISGRVALFAADLRRSRWLAEGLVRPTGIACNADTIWVAETGAHRIRVLRPGGLPATIGQRGSGDGQFNFPVALAFSGATLFVGDTLNFRIQELDAASGRFLRAFGGLGDAAGDTPRLKGLAIDGAGNVWASDAHLDSVSLYNPAGMLLLSLGGTGSAPGEFAFPAGIAAHPDGRVAVADALNRRVQVFRLLPAPARP